VGVPWVDEFTDLLYDGRWSSRADWFVDILVGLESTM